MPLQFNQQSPATAIPDFQTLMLSVLRCAANGEVEISNVVSQSGIQLALPNAALSALLPSGKQTTFANRVTLAGISSSSRRRLAAMI